jgi:hypothetical protein
MRVKLFRYLIHISDRINIKIKDIFNLDPKRKILEKKQDLISLRELDRTIGKSIGAIRSENSKSCTISEQSYME